MRVLLYGSGAREHALAWKIKQSPLLTELFLACPNDGFSDLGRKIEFSNNTELAQRAKEANIDLLIVGPEKPLVEGLADDFRKIGIPAIGAEKKWAMLEGSKSFAKEFMKRNSIQTADYEIIEHSDQISAALKRFNPPFVIKADGLTAGKGVVIVKSEQEARETLNRFLEGKYSDASKKIVLEEFLTGDEISLISFWDGKTLLPLIPARDYKRLLDKNQGPNTGGMGAYCPVKLTSNEKDQLNKYVKILETSLKSEKADFAGIIYSGLILTNNGIKVLEYNMRFGDPECQPLLCHMKSDLLKIFRSMTEKNLDKTNIEWNNGISFCVVGASKGYPDNPEKGASIKDPASIKNKYGVEVFYAGVKEQNGLITDGGRVLSVCKTSGNPKPDVYKAIEELKFKGMHYRKDIGDF